MEELEWEYTITFKKKLLLNEFREYMLNFKSQLRFSNNKLEKNEKRNTIIFGHHVRLNEESTYYPFECFFHRFTRMSTKKCNCIDCIRERNHILSCRKITNTLNILSHLPFRKNFRQNPLFCESINYAYPELQIDKDTLFIPFYSDLLM